ncbi:hypothetical protein [Leptospira sp. severe_002]|uniref:hypothetical protein n=1 Tax=Leptospira sp. severe_002 TaxID=2838237 RepID=UPI001E5B1F92|nr:hypothetical protein [Leptospira sp. severe_002]
MRIAAVSVALIAGLSLPAAAGDYTLGNRPQVVFPSTSGAVVHVSPFPMSRRSADVWGSDACWRACTSHGAWRLDACMNSAGLDQNACRAALDADDRACLRSCRTNAGPLLNITN